MTARQAELLSTLAQGPQIVNDSYPPAANLLRLGFIVCAGGKWGANRYEITEAGRSALAGTPSSAATK